MVCLPRLTLARQLSKLSLRRRFVAAVVVAAIVSIIAVGSALASGYWNVWQGNLSSSAHSVYGGGSPWLIRLSWTSGTHDMNFSWISNNGSWYNASAEAIGNEYNPGSFYDRIVAYDSGVFPGVGVAQAGCQNPASTVYTNCRNAATA